MVLEIIIYVSQMIIRPTDVAYMGLLSLQIFVTLLIGSYAYRGYREIGDSRLLNIYLGFTVIGGGMLVELLIFIFTHIVRPLFYMLVADYVSAVAQLIGYMIIVVGYYRLSKEETYVASPLTSLILPLMMLYLGSSILLIFILYKVLVSYFISRDRGLLFSIYAFILLSISYIIISIGVARPESGITILGNFLRLLGFTLITLSIYRASRGSEYE